MRKVCSFAIVLACTVIPWRELSSAVPPAERLEGGSAADDGDGYFASNYYLSDENPYAPASAGDSDLGEQVILRKQRKRGPVDLRVGTFLYWSDNIASAETDEEEGWFYGGSLSARWKQRLTAHLFFESYAYQDVYFYDQDGLDFESSELGAGLVANLPFLDDVSIFGRYEFLYVHADNPLFGVFDDNEHVDNRYHRLRVGAYKALYSKPSHLVSLSTNARWDFDASSGTQRRQQISARLAYTWAATGRLNVTGFYRASFRDYLASNREDWNQYLGLEFKYALADWAQIYASILYGTNDSNLAGRDYEAVQAGLSLGLRASF